MTSNDKANPRKPWQFGLRTLFAVMTCVAVMAAFLASGRWTYLLGMMVIVNAILFCIIAGKGLADDNEEQSTTPPKTKEISE